MIYLFVLLLVLFPVFHYEKNGITNNKYYWLLCVLLILFMGLRYRVGGDCLRYEVYFDASPDLNEFLRGDFILLPYQPLWYLFIAISKNLSDDFFVFQFVQCAVINIVVFYYAYKHSCHKFTFVALFYCFEYLYFSTEIMRESLAIVVFLLSIDFLSKKAYLKYFALAIIAYLFHTSAIILFAMPLCYKILVSDSNYKRILTSLAIIFAVQLLSTNIGVFIGSSNFIGNEIVNEKINASIEYGGLNIFGLISRLFFSFAAIVSFVILNKSSHNSDINKVLLTVYLITILIPFIYVPLGRFQNYFVIPFLVIFSDLLYDFEANYSLRRTVKLGLYVMIISEIISMNTYIKHSYISYQRYKMYFPYSSVLTKESNAEREHVMSTQFQ